MEVKDRGLQGLRFFFPDWSHLYVQLMPRLSIYSEDANVCGCSHRLTRDKYLIGPHRNTSSTETVMNNTGNQILFLHPGWGEKGSLRCGTHICTCMCSLNLPYPDPGAGIQITPTRFCLVCEQWPFFQLSLDLILLPRQGESILMFISGHPCAHTLDRRHISTLVRSRV